MAQIKYSDIISAQQCMKGIIKETALTHSKTFSKMAGSEIYMKLENLQTTGSFKVRGAFNKLYHLSEEEKKHPIVAASAGNHAQGVAFSASQLGLKSIIFMPSFAPPSKVNATKGYGAEVVLVGDTFDDAFAASQEYCKEKNGTYIHPFNDELIIAGQGVVGLEIFRQLPEVDTVIVPIGGGGLISGIAIALKEINPNIKIIGVEAEGAASMLASKNSDEVLTLPHCHTIADGIAVKKPGDLTFGIVKNLVDDLITVSDKELAHSTYLLLQRGKLLAEPSGTAAIAAAIFKKSSLIGKYVVPVVSGGNVNMSLFQQILDQGMTQEGLRTHIQFIVPDQAGELKRVLSVLEQQKVNIQDIIHERSITSVPVGKVLISVTVNLQNKEQLDIIKQDLNHKGITCRNIM
ncbi:MAG TPA: threonine ammonia-lyase [Bacteroidales bacterium]|jgi:threonine dehydratase|nr:threonine ammonia-lyase [Bacteroidales bacterium]HPE40560.1 threonine ammonia-lyase [Bacteroidales bacterium]